MPSTECIKTHRELDERLTAMSAMLEALDAAVTDLLAKVSQLEAQANAVSAGEDKAPTRRRRTEK